ncbi:MULTISPECIES: FCD domain-containing protein [Marinomonas]|uniref:GntR family transcriptional regulator n=1 Tax=Marinomonas alcarazii TaxID=491949 RepID=A0A318VDA4_9GAMM|nr:MULTISPECIES: FCD domain-containing protein [Marinomonas]PYF84345.1 GntR family transcriptional regulator [Marinomonas alcarazii]
MINSLVKPKRLYQEVGLKLYEELRKGRYQIGDRLPPERDIAEQLGVSRTLLREALIMLELMEVVEVRKGSGVYLLKQPTSIKSTDRFEESLDKDDVGPFEMMQARQLLESHVAEFAASQATKKDILKMRDALELEKQTIDTADKNHEADKLFHLAIAEATQNSVLVDLVKTLWERRENSPMWKQLHSHIIDQAYRKKWLIDHENILLAIQQKKPDAARMAMWRHLENVKDTLMLLSEHQDPNFDGYLFSTNPVQLPTSN